MPYVFSPVETTNLADEFRCIEDRRNNPVRGRNTQFRLRQQNMLAYTFSFVPGFSNSGINNMPYASIVDQPLVNADLEGRLLFGADYIVTSEQKAKVAGDIFEEVEASILWNAAARWNFYMRGGIWPSQPRYVRPALTPRLDRQVAVVSLPRRYDWVRMLPPTSIQVISDLRDTLEQSDLSLPTSTPDILVLRLPETLWNDDRFATELPDLSLANQRVLTDAHRDLEGHVEPVDFLLAIALKRSLRSDRLYQPLYEANIMQLLLEGSLGADQIDFEVHTLESSGTRAGETYRAASLSAVATRHARPHRAVRDLYHPPTATELVKRFFVFLNGRLA